MRTVTIARSARRLAAAAATLTLATALAAAVLAADSLCPDPAARAALLRSVCWLLVVGGVAGTFLAGDGRR